jgi:WD40 repeat protein
MGMSAHMTFEKENYVLITLAVCSHAFSLAVYSCTDNFLDPVTSVVPTQDSQTFLVTSLDSHLRLMDVSTGKMLNDFSGHKNSSYRCRGCFGHGEASVLVGDEDGKVWAWDLVDVCAFSLLLCLL